MGYKMKRENDVSFWLMIYAGVSIIVASVIGFCLAAGVIWSMAFFKSLIFG